MKNPIIRVIYVYLFSLVGLAMFVVGASMIINLGLKSWIFTRADEVDEYYSRPAAVYLKDPELETVKSLDLCADKCSLTAEEKEQIANWLNDYEQWKIIEQKRDPNAYLVRNRQKQAATAISLILVGLPLWLFHWTVIKRDMRGKEEKQESV